jgi:hypothetical protein
VIVPASVPELPLEIVTHASGLPAFHERLPVPLLDTSNVVVPALPETLWIEGDTERAGRSADWETVTICILSIAPGAVTVIVAILGEPVVFS